MRKLFGSLLLFQVLISAEPPAGPIYTVCEVLANRDFFNGRIIAVRGVRKSSSESAWIESGGCAFALYSNEHKWIQAINLSITETLQPWPEWLRIQDKAALKRIRLWIQDQKPATEDEIWLTFIGKLETFDNLDKQVSRLPDGNKFINGLGHLAAYPAQILVVTVLDPEIRRVGKENRR